MRNDEKRMSGYQRLSTVIILGMLVSVGLVGLLIYTPNVKAADPDYIIIRDAPNGGGNPVGDMDYSLGENDIFYCAGYNYTSGYIDDYEANWYSTNAYVGEVNPTSNSNWTEFQTVSGGVLQVRAYIPGGPYNTTGDLTVTTPIDYIIIRDAPNGSGQWVGEKEYAVYEEETYYAAGYNNTS